MSTEDEVLLEASLQIALASSPLILIGASIIYCKSISRTGSFMKSSCSTGRCYLFINYRLIEMGFISSTRVQSRINFLRTVFYADYRLFLIHRFPVSSFGFSITECGVVRSKNATMSLFKTFLIIGIFY